jgi:hypothetical protein
MPFIGQTWVLASIGAVVEMGVLSTLKRLLMESILIAVKYCRHCSDSIHHVIGTGLPHWQRWGDPSETKNQSNWVRHWAFVITTGECMIIRRIIWLFTCIMYQSAAERSAHRFMDSELAYAQTPICAPPAVIMEINFRLIRSKQWLMMWFMHSLSCLSWLWWVGNLVLPLTLRLRRESQAWVDS